jgi:hypothetical protein
MLVRVKSTPSVVDRSEHRIASLPVTVKEIDAVLKVDAAAASVTVGAVESSVNLTTIIPFPPAPPAPVAVA